jgi:hypothetical protein
VIQNFNVDSFFVDAGLTYNGAPATTIAGLAHLNGEVVAVVADGKVIFDGNPAASNAADFTVAAGTIPHVLAVPASVIHAGLAIRYADLELLDLDVQGADIRDKKKRVGSVTLLLEGSVRTFYAGPSDVDELTRVKLNPEETGLEGVPFTGQEEINVSADWNDYGRVLIRHTDPLPFTVLGVLPNLTIGG